MDTFATLAEFYREGGIVMWPTTVLGLAALGLALRQFVHRAERGRAAVWQLVMATLASGVLGTIAGFVATFRYVQQVPAGGQATITLLGLSESLHNLELALVLTLLSLLSGLVGSLRRPPPPTASAPG
jgi:hypothetical protein